MQIFNPGAKVSKEDPMQQYDFNRFENQAGDFYLLEARVAFGHLEKIKDKKIVYLQAEEPNRFLSPDPYFRGDNYDTYFYKILTICPYTAKWLNKIHGTNRWEVVFRPINEEKVPPKAEKKYDVIYVGGIFSKEISGILRTLRKFNYRFVARSKNKYVTDRDVTYKEKMKLLSETKIAVVYGLLVANGKWLRAAWSTPNIEENEAFSALPKRTWYNWLWSFVSTKEYIIPQFKTRAVETAASQTLMLCRRDPWNVIEKWYTPDVDFVYYDEGRLEEKLREILADWHTGKYQKLIENAYQKTMREYTTKAFFEKYLKDLV
ncbi:MAG: glycosyltransferase [Patescibacteria group bacterium]